MGASHEKQYVSFPEQYWPVLAGPCDIPGCIQNIDQIMHARKFPYVNSMIIHRYFWYVIIVSP